ncbi:MAG TPA: hypothetical protein VMG40_13065 [Bryobacteraceae bacterium]|nr:hypothetical protein [Bryobacteraceae bacterium]
MNGPRSSDPVTVPSVRPSLRRKSLLFALIAIVTNVSGNLLLSRGLRGLMPHHYWHVLANPWVDGGIAVLAMWLLTNLSLLSWADLSYVLPITSGGYALSAVSGFLALGEHVSTARWVGIVLITAGSIVVSRTTPRTTP